MLIMRIIISMATHFSPGGTLLQRSDLLPGYTYLSILVDKIGLKDPLAYADPFITVSVKSRSIIGL